MAPDDLIFAVADALAVNLKHTGNHVRGASAKAVKLGPWSVTAEVVVADDVLNADQAAFLVRVMGNAWLYVISEKSRLLVIVFDGAGLNLKARDVVSAGANGVVATLKKITPHIRAQYSFGKDERWIELPLPKAA